MSGCRIQPVVGTVASVECEAGKYHSMVADDFSCHYNTAHAGLANKDCCRGSSRGDADFTDISASAQKQSVDIAPKIL